MVSLPPKVLEAAQVLRVDRVTAEVVGLFEGAGIRTVLLKGPSFRGWLYPEGGRSYTDSDLLVPSDRLEDARAVLRDAGFELAGKQRAFNDPQPGYAWARPSDGAQVDLHESIHGVGVEPGRFWGAVSAGTTTMEVGGRRVEVFGLAVRLLHVVLHAAQHSEDRPTTQVDLERGVDAAVPELWSETLALARRLDAVETFRRGLALTGRGDEVARALGLEPWVDPGPTVEQVLRRTSPGEPVVGGLAALLKAKGLRKKASLVVYRVFAAESLRAWTPLARRGSAGLWVARVARPFWLLLRMPRAIPRFLAARRTAREARRERANP
ncbi:MAG: nucleotidyltransferase family protein [Actinomycetota bacterium]|nr:nucleotidyltransferase family protein [Actinomycetota bacterium]